MRRRGIPRGFTLVELLIAVAVIAVITAIGMPLMLSALRAASIQAGAEELASALNGARQLAVAQNRPVCATYAGDIVRYRLGAACDVDFAPPREVRLTSGVTVTSASANVRFTYLGAAEQAVNFTVTDPHDNRTLTVAVATSGRIRIQP